MSFKKAFISVFFLLLSASLFADGPEKILVCHVGNEMGPESQGYDPNCDPEVEVCYDAGRIKLIEVSQNSNHLGNEKHGFPGFRDYEPDLALVAALGAAAFTDTDEDNVDQGCQLDFDCPESGIRYDFDRTIGAGSVVGFIETNVTQGFLSNPNILAFEVTITDGLGNSVFGNTRFNISGENLRADEEGLKFDFSSANDTYVYFDASPISWNLIDAAGAWGEGNASSENIYNFGFSGGLLETEAYTGLQLIAPVNVACNL